MNILNMHTLSTLFCVVLLLVVSPAEAQASSNAANKVALDCGSGGPVISDACLQASDADTQWRWLGKSSGANCPQPEGVVWTTSRLFEDSNGEFQPGLGEYCEYTTNSSQANTQFLQALRCTTPPGPTPCLTQLDPDSASLASMGSDTADLIWPQLYEFFREQVGVVGPLALSGGQNVRLSVIDTEPTGFNEDRNGSGVSSHGFTLLNIVRDTICPTQGPCPVQIRSKLGLPMQRCEDDIGFCFDPIEGGVNGTIGQLANAIFDEIDDWRTSGVEQLILNLSVAWDPIFNTAAPAGNNRVAVQSMFEVLQYASCRGVLVIAAAGNRVTGPTLSAGALLPGGWETESAPSLTQCQSAFGFTPDSDDIAGSYRPLIYAVGAVNERGDPVETRTGGEPRLTAFGDHAVARVDEGVNLSPSQILTGSSIGAIVVSAAAAQSWHVNNSASLHQLMQDIYDSGLSPEDGRSADFCNTALANCKQEVRRVTICQAVDKACSNLTAGTCPEFNCEPPGDVLPGIPEEDLASLYVGAGSYSLAKQFMSTPFSECRPGYLLFYEAGVPGVNPCPHIQFYAAQATPWTDGQPEGQYCPTCTDVYHSPGTLYLEIDSGLEGFLTDVTFLCGDDAYRVPGELVAGDKKVITDIPELCESRSIAVAFRLSNNPNSMVSVASPTLRLEDRDDDGVQDGLDNCLDVLNADQVDANGDGIGNACDGDFNDDCLTNFQDYFLMSEAFLGTDPVIDLTGDGLINFLDIARFAELAFQPPGPSGTTKCTVSFGD